MNVKTNVKAGRLSANTNQTLVRLAPNQPATK